MEAIIAATRPDETYFAVMLRHAPSFPDEGDVKPIDVQPLAVVAANNDNGGWGWATLDEAEKDVVGDALLNFGASVDVWHWCQLKK